MKGHKRVPLITWMQVFGCFCVILGHSFPFVTEIPRSLITFRLFLYSFHMPLFVFCSGVLLELSGAAKKYKFGSFSKRRAIRLLLPYVAFSLIGIVPKILLSPFLNDSLSLDLWQIIRAFFVPRENIWGHFWFLPMIFFCGLLGYWLSRAFQKGAWLRWAALAVTFGMLFLPKVTNWFTVDDLVHHVFWFVLGMCAAKLYLKTDALSQGGCYLFGSMAFCAGIGLFLLTYSSAMGEYDQILVTGLMLAAVSLLLLPLSRAIVLKPDSLLNRSYSIFILSWPCQLAVELVLERILVLPYWCIMPCMLLAGIAVPCVLIKIIDRIERNSKHKVLTRVIGG